jgi:hypothetical protein
MKVIIRWTFFLVLIVFFSCENGFFISCPDCLDEEPSNTLLTIKLEDSSNSSSKSIPTISIYEGNVEDNILLHRVQTSETTIEQQVLLNKKYTVTALYLINGKKYIAIDSATPRVKYDKAQCDNPCYFVYDKNLNLKLKFE